jgi:phosphatidylethanolamine-binding protein (PEBP) family uncharacterized protein
VHFLDTVPSSSHYSVSNNNNNDNNTNNNHLNFLNTDIQLTIALTDPDAPSRQNPKWSQMCHWIATDVRLSTSSDDELLPSNSHRNKHHHRSLTEIMPYKPPGPPPKTGRHRYVFVALAPLNGTTERLDLSVPGGL